MRVDSAAPLAGGEPAGAPFLASMGIYVFTPEALRDLLTSYPEQHDFGREIIPHALSQYKVAVHAFRGYWEDIGTIAAFYRANLALAVKGEYSLYDPDFPLYTRPRYLSPTCVRDATINDSLIAEGSLIGRATIRNSVVGIRSRIADGVELDGALVMGNDNYETSSDRAACRARGFRHSVSVPDRSCGRRSSTSRCGSAAGSKSSTPRASRKDGENYYIRDGIVIIPRDAMVPDGTVI